MCMKCDDEKNEWKRGPRPSWDTDSIREFVKTVEPLWELVSNKYKNNRTKLQFKCSCGHDCFISWDNFKKGRRCAKCSRKKKYEFDEVKSIIESFPGYLLLSIEYINAHTNLLIKFPCGHDCEMCFNNFRQGNGCLTCQYINLSGERNTNWNPDRERVRLNEKSRKLCGSLLRRVLLQTTQSKTSKTYILLGYDNKELEYMLSKDPLWENFKQYNGEYHIDHIFPIKSFAEHDITDPAIINALDNLQILSAKDNLEKRDKYIKEDFYKYLDSKNIIYTRI